MIKRRRQPQIFTCSRKACVHNKRVSCCHGDADTHFFPVCLSHTHRAFKINELKTEVTNRLAMLEKRVERKCVLLTSLEVIFYRIYSQRTLYSDILMCQMSLCTVVLRLISAEISARLRRMLSEPVSPLFTSLRLD